MNSNTEAATSALATGPAEPNANKKANVAKGARHLAPAKSTSAKKASPATEAPKSRTKTKVAKPEAREGSKTARVLGLLKRPGGVTAKELMKATGWQPHSVRGFLSGTVGKKMRLNVTSVKGEAGERAYKIVK